MSTLPPLNIRYPFDPTGVSPDNLVRDELHTLPPVHNRIIVPKLGAYYANSLIVKQQGKVLEKDKDYELAALYHDASVEVGQDVNVMIYISNMEIDGDIEITYQVVGGEFTGVWEAIQQYVNVLLVDPRKVRWDDILHKPELYAPLDHFHDINDVYGLNHLIPKLEEIRQAVMRIRSREMRKVYDRIFKIKKDVEEAIKNASTTIVNNVQNQINNTEELNTLRATINALRLRIEALEQDNGIQEALRLLREKDTNYGNHISALEDNKATKTELTEKYNELIGLINGLNRTGNSGLTYEDLNTLPVKPYSEGTTVLARNKNGEYYRLSVSNDFYQDVGVSMIVDQFYKTIPEGRSVEFNLKTTVTNSGNQNAENITLLIQLPNLPNTPYTFVLGDIISSNNVGEVVNEPGTDNKLITFRISNIPSKSTVIINFKISTSDVGSFQIGSQVATRGKVDTNNQNNHASITLVASKTVNLTTNNVYTPPSNLDYGTDCPLITVTNRNTGTRYNQMLTESINNSRGNSIRVIKVPLERDVNTSVFTDISSKINRIDVSELSLDVQGATRFLLFEVNPGNMSYLNHYNNDTTNKAAIVISSTKDDSYINTYVDFYNSFRVDEVISNNLVMERIDTLSWDATNKVLTITNILSNRFYYLACKPEGERCNWQVFGFSVKNRYRENVLNDYNLYVADKEILTEISSKGDVGSLSKIEKDRYNLKTIPIPYENRTQTTNDNMIQANTTITYSYTYGSAGDTIDNFRNTLLATNQSFIYQLGGNHDRKYGLNAVLISIDRNDSMMNIIMRKTKRRNTVLKIKRNIKDIAILEPTNTYELYTGNITSTRDYVIVSKESTSSDNYSFGDETSNSGSYRIEIVDNF